MHWCTTTRLLENAENQEILFVVFCEASMRNFFSCRVLLTSVYFCCRSFCSIMFLPPFLCLVKFYLSVNTGKMRATVCMLVCFWHKVIKIYRFTANTTLLKNKIWQTINGRAKKGRMYVFYLVFDISLWDLCLHLQSSWLQIQLWRLPHWTIKFIMPKINLLFNHSLQTFNRHSIIYYIGSRKLKWLTLCLTTNLIRVIDCYHSSALGTHGHFSIFI